MEFPQLEKAHIQQNLTIGVGTPVIGKKKAKTHVQILFAKERGAAAPQLAKPIFKVESGLLKEGLV